ncbi:amino acid ABC transporter permease [Pseudonocardia sp. H11422]|uniref:amino acid ABC transporter permease n=1 Tax=Pseudonocardia sp. H11422 TaxID=2835866 RepID=UPI001BDC9EF4|nr:amino acid ABC transporter permease [Pseudonocardia sp. H11422]
MSSVLYDIPGPKARARNRLVSYVGVVLIVAAVGYVLYRLAATGQFEPIRWEWITYEAIQILLLQALLNTLSAFATAAVLSLALGALFAAARLSDHPVLRAPATVVVEFFRAIPVLVLIFFIYFGLPPAGINISTFWAVVIGLTLYNGSVLAEVFRAGVLALPRGQSEAAYALGMRKTQVMTTVLLPQALRAMLPTIVSQLVVVLKDTALGFLIGYPELLFAARTLGSQGDFQFPIIPVAIVVAIIYITMCLLLSLLADYLEKRTRRSPRRSDIDESAATKAENEMHVSHVRGGGDEITQAPSPRDLN